MEFGLQCDYLLGQHCGGVEQLKNDAQHNVIQTFRRFAPPDHRGKRLSRGEAAVSRGTEAGGEFLLIRSQLLAPVLNTGVQNHFRR